MNPTAGLSRREMLKFSGAALLGVPMSGWLNVLAARAAQNGQTRHKHCVLLWMDGGPSHKDTFDLKPGTANGGPFRAVPTNVPGIQISEHFPRFSRLMSQATLLRGMSTPEGAHGRAKYYMHTGYREGSGGLVYPSIGSICSNEIGRPDFNLPNYVCIGNRSYGSGFLGPRHQPLVINEPNRGVENLRPAVEGSQFGERVDLLREMEQGFFRNHPTNSVEAHNTTYRRAVTLLQSREARAFDLAAEPASARSAYGNNRFGESCLLARRLIETGVAFVEVVLGGWDTHQNNFARVRTLSDQVDPAMSQLTIDLRERGLLDDTLIIWMGEFGRTPRINARGAQPGRDHYPRAWSSVMIGGGLPHGRVVGRTDAEGAAVVEGRVTGLDFMASVCRTLGIDYNKMNNTPNGRPVRIVDRGGSPLPQLF